MAKTYPNDPINQIQENATSTFGGLSKREYFAALAMRSLLSNPANMGNNISEDAAMAVDAADALIEELNKKVEG